MRQCLIAAAALLSVFMSVAPAERATSNSAHHSLGQDISHASHLAGRRGLGRLFRRRRVQDHQGHCGAADTAAAVRARKAHRVVRWMSTSRSIVNVRSRRARRSKCG